MATYRFAGYQSTKEKRTWRADFTDDLPAGVAVAGATATHVPPSGSAATPTVHTIENNVAGVAAIVPVSLDLIGSTALGEHYLDVVATLNNVQSEKPHLRLLIRVNS
jgi:hypothetical protein